jgi:hypothetical protein
VIDPDRQIACRNCGRTYGADQLDRARWCERCREVVIRRATLLGRALGLIAALALLAWVLTTIGSAPRFLVAWGILLAAVYFFVYKVTQRVAFEIIRGVGVRRPPAD